MQWSGDVAKEPAGGVLQKRRGGKLVVNPAIE
jgi:hypothetical protein